MVDLLILYSYRSFRSIFFSFQVFALFLETLCELVSSHKADLHDWLYVLLTRLVVKLGKFVCVCVCVLVCVCLCVCVRVCVYLWDIDYI